MAVESHILPLDVQVVEVVYVMARRGDGTPGSPERSVHLYYSKTGDLLACYDPVNGPVDYFEVRPAPGLQESAA